MPHCQELAEDIASAAADQETDRARDLVRDAFDGGCIEEETRSLLMDKLDALDLRFNRGTVNAIENITETQFREGESESDGDSIFETNTLWLEYRISQGRPVTAEDANDVAGIVEEALEAPARQVFCASQQNIVLCFVRFDTNVLPTTSLVALKDDVRRPFQDVAGKSLDELNVVDEQRVADRVPEAIGEMPAGI